MFSPLEVGEVMNLNSVRPVVFLMHPSITGGGAISPPDG